MNKLIKTLIIPSSNEPGFEVFHSLFKNNKIKVFCGSSHPYSKYDPTRILNKKNYIEFPLFNDPSFIPLLKKVIKKHKIDCIFPTTDELVHQLSQINLEKTQVVCTNKESALVCLSKKKMYELLRDVIPTPKVFNEKDDKLKFPLYGKPDIGCGSKNHLLINSSDSLKLAKEKDLMIMEYLPGEEYTVDCLNDLDGKLLFHNIRIRGSISRGISLGTRSTKNELISKYIRTIVKKIKINGPWFAQFKLDNQKNPKLLEINARIGGSSTHTRLSGINIPLMSVFLFNGYKIRKPNFKINSIVNTRFLTNAVEIPKFKFNTIIWDFDDTIFTQNGFDEMAIALISKFKNKKLKQIVLTKNKKVKSLIKELLNTKIFEYIIITEDKINFLKKIINERNKRNILIINDSFVENFAFYEHFKNIKIVTPDRLEILLNNNNF